MGAGVCGAAVTGTGIWTPATTGVPSRLELRAWTAPKTTRSTPTQAMTATATATMRPRGDAMRPGAFR